MSDDVQFILSITNEKQHISDCSVVTNLKQVKRIYIQASSEFEHRVQKAQYVKIGLNLPSYL